MILFIEFIKFSALSLLKELSGSEKYLSVYDEGGRRNDAIVEIKMSDDFIHSK